MPLQKIWSSPQILTTTNGYTEVEPNSSSGEKGMNRLGHPALHRQLSSSPMPIQHRHFASDNTSSKQLDSRIVPITSDMPAFSVTARVDESHSEIWNNKKYTTYKVTINTHPPEAGIGRPHLQPLSYNPFLQAPVPSGKPVCHSWTISHRYADFSRLYETLRRSFPDVSLKLPGKRLLLNNFDPGFIEHRRAGLDNFIQALVQEDRLLHHAQTLEFLRLAHSVRVCTVADFGPAPYNYVHHSASQASQACSYYSQAGQTAETEDTINLGPSERKLVSPKDFDFLKVIGKGSFGKVLLARHREEDRVFAVKVLQKQQIRKNNEVRHIMSERNILLKNVQHPFLVGLHYSFQTPDKLYFVLDYVNGGELFHHLQRERYFPEARARFYSAEIATALSYLHSLGIIYRDLKPENLLLDSEGHIRLTDFGLCKEGITAQGATTSTFCGTPEYLAPEILRKQPYTNVVDWWCLGAVLYEMLYGLPPFYSRDTAEMYDSILHKPLRLRTNVSEVVRDLLEHLLQKDPRFRLGFHKDFEEISVHPFFRHLDWGLLLERKIAPPYNPNVSSNYDLKHIDPEFTQEPVPASVTGNGQSVEFDHNRNIFKPRASLDNAFAGFTYVPPIEGL